MKIRNLIRIASLTTLLLAFVAGPSAQEAAPDKVKLSAGFTNTEYSFESLFSTEYEQGLTAELDARIFKKSGIRLGGVFQYNRNAVGADLPIDTYSFGPQLSVDLFKGVVSPFGRALFGFQTTYNSDRVFTRAYGVGVDVNLGHVFIRPVVVDWIRTEGFGSPATQRFGAGVGVRF
ncbi:MAG TPA: outer membrane beta-barrel protein [Blastocatellia bacterium]|nr:outer membrane beta-barrel protein [Blastocatellia bacterium]